MEKGGSCELCSKAARMYCDSDEARLCWDCDEKVHSANFLVAKHSRSLLCHVCQSPTPWKASGTKLGPTISVCESCFNSQNPAIRMSTRRHEQVEEAGGETESLDDDQYSDSENDSDDYEEEEEDDDEDDGENQVVPWSSNCPTASSSGPPLTNSSSSEQGSLSTRDGGATVSSALKQSRETCHLDSDDEEDVCCSSQVNMNTGAIENRRASFRSLKMGRAEEEEELVHRPETDIELMRRKRRRMELLGSFMSFQQTAAGAEHHNTSEVIQRISNLSRDAL